MSDRAPEAVREQPPGSQGEPGLAADLALAKENGDRDALIEIALQYPNAVDSREEAEEWADMMLEGD